MTIHERTFADKTENQKHENGPPIFANTVEWVHPL